MPRHCNYKLSTEISIITYLLFRKADHYPASLMKVAITLELS
jgi:hypothetical protein